MKIKQYLLPLSIGVTLLTGCATSQKVQVVQMGDDKLSCATITEELAQLDKADTEVNSKKGVTGTNVAAALFFWPALAYTYIDAKDANEAISDRRSHLTAIGNKKNCQ